MIDNEELLREKIRAIYSETTADHVLHPRNEESLPNPDGYAVAQSGCGETMKIWLRLVNDHIFQTGFWTDGCAVTIACGSMATELVKGKLVMEAMKVDALAIAEALVDLPQGNFHCAELAAQALRTALKNCLEVSQDPWKKFYRK